MKVMIVEDTAILRRVMRDILKEFCGVTDDNIHECEDAIKAIKSYKVVNPDIVFMDIAMPEINGKKALGQLLTIDPGANIIMFTGSQDLNDVVECINAGAKDYLIKPLQPERVRDAVRKTLARTPEKLTPILRNDS